MAENDVDIVLLDDDVLTSIWNVTLAPLDSSDLERMALLYPHLVRKRMNDWLNHLRVYHGGSCAFLLLAPRASTISPYNNYSRCCKVKSISTLDIVR